MTTRGAEAGGDRRRTASVVARRLGILAVFGLLLGAGVFASSSSGLDCHFGDPNYNTILCGISKKQAGERCAEFAHEYPSRPVAAYVAGSTSMYKIRIEAEGLTGCNAAGTRAVTYFQELRKGPSGPYVRSGRITTRSTNVHFTIKDVQTIPYDCSVDAPGSVVRTLVLLSWHPSRGWGGSTTPRNAASKPLTIC
jgi:hypothetical protein